jgi:hypothetical protein
MPALRATRNERGAHEQPEASDRKAKSNRRRAQRAWGVVLRTLPRRGLDLAKRDEAQGGRRGRWSAGGPNLLGWTPHVTRHVSF